jgi:acyl transferase domain-containing protein/phosphopantetheinyl transferase
MAHSRDPGRDVAIVGMACVFPGAGDLATFWRNIREGRDAIRDVPPGRWDPEFFDPASSAVGRLYCKRGGFVDEFATFDPLRWGVMPVAAEAAEPDQLLALEVAARALADAGYAERPFPREAAGVILGRGGYIGAGVARFSSKIRNCEEVVLALRALLPDLAPATLEDVRREFQGQLGRHGPDTVIGIVPNLTASRIANRLDLRGPAYTVDAACASSLIAVDRACADLATGRADFVLAGGIHLVHDVSFWSVFCQMGALSRRQEIRPFDRGADGILIGEGVGVLALKRLADARRDGDRIWAVVRGTGVSSDGRAASLLTPAVEGQRLALERAWQQAGLDPTAERSLGLVEAHGTATHAGDAAEIATLRAVFGDAGRPGAIGLGSVKSMIGHAMPAAGAAGLIKAALAVHHGVLPPTLHCEDPHEALAGSRFRPLVASEPWEASGAPRRAAVNAFGFGGINAHVLIEQEEASGARPAAIQVPAPPAVVLLRAAEDPAALAAALRAGGPGPGTGPCRIAVVDPTPERVELALRAIERGRPFRDRRGIWFTPRGLAAEGGKIAFVFPGVDADFRPQVEDVARQFGRRGPDGAAVLSRATALERTGAGILWVNRLLHDVLVELGVRPDFVCGHSIGEWSAMVAAGIIADADVARLARELEPGMLAVPAVVFGAAGCGEERAREALAGLDGVVVSHDNCPHQVILCGPEAGIDLALARLAARGVLCQKLEFRSGFHTPLFGDYLGPVREALAGLELHAPRLSVLSATTCEPYPASPERIRELFLRHLVSPVRFREMTVALHELGARLFVQVGTGSLVGFVDDTLKERPHLAIGANSPKRAGLEQLRRTSAALWVEGVALDHARLFGLHEVASAGALRLALGAPLVRLAPRPVGLARPAPPEAPAPADDPVLAEFRSTLATLDRAGREVEAAWRSGTAPSGATEAEVTIRRRLDVAQDRHLLDHCFFPQPAGWPDPGDRFPVVPMTMSLAMMLGAARRLAGERVVVALEQVRARRWLVVERPVEVTIRARRDGQDAIAVSIDDYIDARARLAPAWPPAPAAERGPLADERPLPLAPDRMYDDRFMFHGPAYRGVVALTGYGAGGIRGILENLPAEGALLDCAGQVFGLWIMLRQARDRMAIPVRVDALTFHGPDPAPHARLDCRVWVVHVGDATVRADIDLACDGRVWCRIRGWEDRRFETDDRLWAMMIKPETNVLAEPHPRIPDCHVLRTDLSRTTTRDYFARRYLDMTGVEAYRAMNPRRQLDWLPGRIAAKDAVRHWLWRHGAGPLFPIEVQVESEPSGRPAVRCAGAGDLRLSLAGKPGITAAIVADGRDVGLDVERVEPRDPGFERAAFGDAERTLLPAGEERDAWVARFWAAKEAVAKCRGTGLAGAPRRLPVQERDGERLVVDGQWVDTLAEGAIVYAWTYGEP